MKEKNTNNIFRLSLYQEDILLCEKMFNADNFNPFTRYSIDIRDLLPKAINILQKELSKKSYDVDYSVGNDKTYELYDEYLDIIDSYKEKYGNRVRYNPRVITQHIVNNNVNMTIRGVECRLGLYINENPIVEREFYVDGFNPVSRWSVDLLDTFLSISENIEERIKCNDVNNIWDDYDMINILHINFNQIINFSPQQRKQCIDKIERIRNC